LRLWITKNSEIPLREQLVRQITLGILSEDLPDGPEVAKCSSAGETARHSRQHRERGLSRSAGARVVGTAPRQRVVRPFDSRVGWKREAGSSTGIRAQAGSAEGYEPEEVLQKLEHLVRPRAYERVLVEPKPGMREILQAEIAEHLSVRVEALEDDALTDSERTLVVALPTRAAKIRSQLPRGVPCLPLRVRSVGGSLEGQTKPGPEVVITIVSRSPEIRYGARAMLIAAGVDPLSLCEIDANSDGWRDRIGSNAFVITDIVAAQQLPAGCRSKIFRVIADTSIAELESFCRAPRL
jgi:hypothetical protein